MSAIDRIQPCNIEAEMSVLGACLQSPDAGDEAMERLTPECFYDPAHRIIFATMRTLWEKTIAIDPVTLAERLSVGGRLDEIGGVVYIAKLDDSVPTVAHASRYIETVEGKWIQRELITRSIRIQESCYDSTDDPHEQLDQAEASLFELSLKTKIESYKTAATVAATIAKRIDLVVSGEQKTAGLSWGFPELDNLTNGLLNADFAIIGARPSMGKTSLMLSICQRLAVVEKVPVGIFSLETTAEQLLSRCLSAEIEVQGIELGKGKIKDWPRYTTALAALADSPLYICDSPILSPLRLRSIARRLCATRGVRLIALDYLQLMHDSGRRHDNRQSELAHICGQLKALARELDIPVLVLSQLNRDVEDRAEKRPVLSDLRDSGAIEQDADIVLFLMRPEYYWPGQQPGIAKVWLSKNRNGPLGAFEVGFQAEYTRFTSLSKQEDKSDYGRATDDDAL